MSSFIFSIIIFLLFFFFCNQWLILFVAHQSLWLTSLNRKTYCLLNPVISSRALQKPYTFSSTFVYSSCCLTTLLLLESDSYCFVHLQHVNHIHPNWTSISIIILPSTQNTWPTTHQNTYLLWFSGCLWYRFYPPRHNLAGAHLTVEVKEVRTMLICRINDWCWRLFFLRFWLWVLLLF